MAARANSLKIIYINIFDQFMVDQFMARWSIWCWKQGFCSSTRQLRSGPGWIQLCSSVPVVLNSKRWLWSVPVSLDLRRNRFAVLRADFTSLLDSLCPRLLIVCWNFMSKRNLPCSIVKDRLIWMSLCVKWFLSFKSSLVDLVSAACLKPIELNSIAKRSVPTFFQGR